MNDSQKKSYMAWLKDAYAMEESLVKVLEIQVQDAEKEGENDIADMIHDHLEKTKRHAELVEGCIERLGSKVSRAKSGFSKLGAIIGTKTAGIADDHMVKNFLNAYSAEHMEMAAYLSIISAAERLEDDETADVCRGILEDEREMAEWLEEQIPTVTVTYLERIVEDEDNGEADDTEM